MTGTQRMPVGRKRGLLWPALCVLWLAGCAGQPFTYRSDTEIKEGPGMFSGKEGGLVVSTEKKKSDTALSDTPPSAEEFREFREFQEFKRWKEANRDTPEYREFREWQEWKAYRSWQQQQRGK